MRLSQGSGAAVVATQSDSITSVVKKESKVTAASGTTDKLKASNFPASLLRIGHWEVCPVHLVLLFNVFVHAIGPLVDKLIIIFGCSINQDMRVT